MSHYKTNSKRIQSILIPRVTLFIIKDTQEAQEFSETTNNTSSNKLVGQSKPLHRIKTKSQCSSRRKNVSLPSIKPLNTQHFIPRKTIFRKPTKMIIAQRTPLASRRLLGPFLYAASTAKLLTSICKEALLLAG